MSELTCLTEILESPRVVIVRTTGYIDEEGGEKIKKVVESLIEKGELAFLFNLSGSPIVNSSGIACILELIEHISFERQGRAVFAALAPAVGSVFKMMGVHSTCTVVDSEEAAIACFGAA